MRLLCDFSDGQCSYNREHTIQHAEAVRNIRIFTWTLLQDSPDIAGLREIAAIKRAFLKWQLVIPVKFKWIPNTEYADITIIFSKTDSYFQTRPNALAYAYIGTTTQEIDLVFNESYTWVLNREVGNNKYDAEIVAIHEIGHVLGLQHSQNSDKDCMWPVYNSISDLSSNDISRMQIIWGARSGFSQLITRLKGYFSKNL